MDPDIHIFLTSNRTYDHRLVAYTVLPTSYEVS